MVSTPLYDPIHCMGLVAYRDRHSYFINKATINCNDGPQLLDRFSTASTFVSDARQAWRVCCGDAEERR